jgi:hypothetical protein
MRQCTLLGVLFAAALTSFTSIVAPALDVVWDGGDGEWNDANWNGGQVPMDLVDRDDGTRRNDVNFIIGSGAVVSFDYPINGDFHIHQGSGLTITDGAIWTQDTLDTWDQNGWTELDPSYLILDGGTFRRTGEAPLDAPGDPFSGGVLTFGSWKADDNYSIGPDPPAAVDITLTNGGKIENEGQLWFGSWGDQPPGLTVTMTINNGAIDLTGGGTNPTTDAFWDGDVAFTYDRDDQGVPKDESYVIDFTGPGSITTDYGIVIAIQDESNTWTGGPNRTYEDLWDMGILRANGLSGLDGASFDEYFTVMGTSGLDDYTLTSLVIPPGGVPGDYNGNGTVEQADLDLVLLNLGDDGATPPGGWINDLPTGTIDQAELDGVLLNWGNAGGLGAAAGVPEPATWLLICLAAAAAAAHEVRRRA